jgi:hypothetical protein
MQILWRNRSPEIRLPKEAVKKLRQGTFYVSKKTPALIAKLSASIGPKLIINGLIFGQTIKFILDTGAQVSCLPRKYIPADKLATLAPAPFELQSYKGSSINVYGSMSCSVKIGTITLNNAVFLVVDHICSPIIGTPEISENHIVINTPALSLEQNGKFAPLELSSSSQPMAGIKLINKKSTFISTGRLSQDITIPPRKTISINISLESQPTSTVCVTPEACIKNKDLQIYDQVVQLQCLAASATIQVANLSNVPLKLPKNLPLCRISEVSIKQLQEPVSGKLNEIMKELKIHPSHPKDTRRRIICDKNLSRS